MDKQNLIHSKSVVVLVILLGSLTWSLTMVRSGLFYPFGMGFWGANGHDGIWHIALTESLSKGSLAMPVFSGYPLQNYHIGFDLFVALVSRLTSLPIVNVYFQVIPPILALSTGILVYRLLLSLGKTKKDALGATFFVYFAGGFGWAVTLFREGKLGGESMFWSTQAISSLINPPFSLSLVLMVSGLILFNKLTKKYSFLYFFPMVILFSLLIQVKVYAGVLALLGLFFAGLFRYVRQRRVELLGAAFVSTALSVILFIPLNSQSGSIVVFQPFWFLETMMQLTDRLGWVRFGEAMVNWRQAGNLKYLIAYPTAFLIFFIGNLGTRVLAFVYFYKEFWKERKVSDFDVFAVTVILAGTAAPTFFLQKGTPWNTIQFLYYSLFFLAIYAGMALAKLGKNVYLLLIIFLLTIPTTLGSLCYDYLPTTAPAKLSTQELQALNFLKNEPNGVILSYPYTETTHEAPVPLHSYTSTAYVSAFSAKTVFLEDQINLDIMQYPWQARRESVLAWLNTLDEDSAYKFLRENNIAYIYWLHGQRARLGETQLGIERIFENEEVDIYKVIE